MPKIIVVASDKGGVGKTTLTTFLSHSLAARGYATMLMDLDENNNLTSRHLPPDALPWLRQNNALGIITGEKTLDEITVQVSENLFLVGSTKELSRSNVETMGDGMVVMNFISAVEEAPHDYIVIDTHPGKKIELQAALASSDLVVSPVAPHLWEMQGYNTILNEIKKARAIKKKMPVVCVSPYMVTESAASLLAEFDEDMNVLGTWIPNQSHVKDKNTLRKNLKPGTILYSKIESLVDEILAQLDKKEVPA